MTGLLILNEFPFANEIVQWFYEVHCSHLG